MMEYRFSHFDYIWPVPTYSIKGWTGLNRYCYPCNGNICTFRNAMWPVVQFYFSNMSRSVQFPSWILSSGSAPQVGSIAISPIQKERFKSHGHRRNVEVLCWGVPLGSLAHFGMAVGSVRSTLGSGNWKALKRFPSFAINVCNKAWLPIGSSLDVL